MDQQDGSASSWPNLTEDLDLDLELNLDLPDLSSSVTRPINVTHSTTGPVISNTVSVASASIAGPSIVTAGPVNISNTISATNSITGPSIANTTVPIISNTISNASSISGSQIITTGPLTIRSTAVSGTSNSNTSINNSNITGTTIVNTGNNSNNTPTIITNADFNPTANVICKTEATGNDVLKGLRVLVPSTVSSSASGGSGTIAVTQLAVGSNARPIGTNVRPVATTVRTAVAQGAVGGNAIISSTQKYVPIAPYLGTNAVVNAPGTAITSNKQGTISSSSSSSTTTASNSSTGITSTLGIPTGNKFIVLTSANLNPEIIAQLKSGKIKLQLPPSAMTTSGGSGTFNITSLSNSGSKPTVSNPVRTTTSYVPIAPSPATHTAVLNSSSNSSSVSTHVTSSSTPITVKSELFAGYIKNHQPNGTSSTGKAGILGVTGSAVLDDANRQRKPCNCTKSQCLKLYCDCFANGEFCSQCNCTNCYNNLDHEDDRQKAIRQCLERNPFAFHPKIGKGRSTGDVTERRHTKGCNCRRSGCLKNYCECYEAKILCSELCKCCGCKNYEDSFERRSLQLMNPADGDSKHGLQAAAKLTSWTNDFRPKLPVQVPNQRFSHSFTQEVIEATCQCLMATAEESERKGLDDSGVEKALLTEFGLCLTQIIDWANKTK